MERIKIVTLSLITTREEILKNFEIFISGAKNNFDLAYSLCRTTSYWVCDSKFFNFGPSKFLGFKNITYTDYELSRQGNSRGAEFNGRDTRKAIEKILGQYAASSEMSFKLLAWGDEFLKPGTFDGLSQEKSRFVTI